MADKTRLKIPMHLFFVRSKLFPLHSEYFRLYQRKNYQVKLPFCFVGKTNIRLEEEKPRIGEVQVCVGLQNQRIEEVD